METELQTVKDLAIRAGAILLKHYAKNDLRHMERKE
jgi:hypothetical protein